MYVTVRALALLVAILAARIVWAGCDPNVDPDRTDVANARAAVAAACDCNGDRHAYVRCASDTAEATLVNKRCAGVVRRCAGRSTCGRAGFVTCCRTRRSGSVSCTVKRSAASCMPPPGGSACVGSLPSCCDACADYGCTATTTTTTSTTTTTFPPPCGPDGTGSCGGTCFDPYDRCEQDAQTGQCVCVLGGCHAFGGIGSCRGTCPGGGSCSLCAACGGCGCIIPCNGGTVPQCNGACPPGYVCGYDGIDPVCLCAPVN